MTSKGEQAMKAVGELVRSTLAEGGPDWSFVIICRLDDGFTGAFESVVYDGESKEAVAMMERAAERIRK